MVILTVIIGQVQKAPTKGIIIGGLALAGFLLVCSLITTKWVNNSQGITKFMRGSVGLSGIVLFLVVIGLWSWPGISTPIVRPYDLTEARRKQLLESSRNQSDQRSVLRFGCPAWSESACVAAGRFMVAFSEAGWKIDGNRVYRMDTNIPAEGVSLVSRASPDMPADLAPHLGWWGKMKPSEVAIWAALTQLEIPVRTSNEKDLEEGVLGVYFRPEPHQLISK